MTSSFLMRATWFKSLSESALGKTVAIAPADVVATPATSGNVTL
jgi:hypothetical protein